MKVLITGCAGYLGSKIVPTLLENNCHVTGVDNLFYKNGYALLSFLGHERFKFVQDDIRTFSLVSSNFHNFDIIIPLAAIVGQKICEDNQDLAWEVNDIAIKNLIKNLSKNQRVIYAATNSGYGKMKDRPCQETDELNPVSTYGKSKVAGEKWILTHENSVSLRLATVYGCSGKARIDLMVNDFVYKLHKYNKLNNSNGNNNQFWKLKLFEPNFRRNFVGIEDVCRGINFMVDRPHKGVFNFGNPKHNLTKLELAELICGELGYSKELIEIGDGKDEDARDYLVSNDKILNIGFQFRHCLQRAIKELVQFYECITSEEAEKMRNM